MHIIQATVNPRLLTNVSRLFTGTLQGRIVELLQNARRAGAKHVEIRNRAGTVTVQDDGKGVDDFGKLLDLGGSGWGEDFEASEDPAGVGLFCLAPRAVTIRSYGQIAQISADGWRGAPVEVVADPEPTSGTFVQFEDDEWSHAIVSPLAAFTGITVAVDDCPCASESFVNDQAAHYPELGCRIEVREAEHVNSTHRRLRSHADGDNALVNLHGQVASFDFRPVSEQGLWFLVDLTGEPTGIRLMQSARTQLVENEAFGRLKAALEVETYRYIQRRRHHRLTYQEYVRAGELGITLPEATPTFDVGVLHAGWGREPVKVQMPEGFPLARCYRIDPFSSGGWQDAANASLLSALGTLAEPFVPLGINCAYDGYSWAKLPTIRRVEVHVGDPVHSACFGLQKLICVNTLAISVHTSDGKTFTSPVCMAEAPLEKDQRGHDVESDVFVTRDARERLRASEILYHVTSEIAGEDAYDRQREDLERELDWFWAHVVGPHEPLRRNALAALAELILPWQSVTVLANGQIRVSFRDGMVQTL